MPRGIEKVEMKSVKVLSMFNVVCSIFFEGAFAILLFGQKDLCFSSSYGGRICIEKKVRVIALVYATIMFLLKFACSGLVLWKKEKIKNAIFDLWLVLQLCFLTLVIIALSLWCLVGSALFNPGCWCFILTTVLFVFCACYEGFYIVFAGYNLK